MIKTGVLNKKTYIYFLITFTTTFISLNKKKKVFFYNLEPIKIENDGNNVKYHFYNSIIQSIILKKGTKVFADTKTKTITFNPSSTIKIQKIMQKYYVNIEGELYPIYFPDGCKRLPYPLSLI